MKLKFSVLCTFTLLALSCAKKPVEETKTTARNLYVASGVCLAMGGNTTFTPATASNIIYKVNLDTGAPGEILADYSGPNNPYGAPPDTPTSIVGFDDTFIYALIDNATNASNRRVEKVPRSLTTTDARGNYYSNTTVFPATASNILRSLFKGADNSIYISRTVAIEKVNTSKQRLPNTSTAWVNNPAGGCANSATVLSSVQVTTSGKTIFTHANTAQNKIGVIGATGYSTAADCLNTMAPPVATAFPTASVYLPTYNMLLVLYAGAISAPENNSVYAYDFNETTGALSGATKAFQDSTVLFGGSAIAVDDSSGTIYVATTNSTTTAASGYNIEKFTFDPTTKTLTRVGTTPFATHWIGSKCISSMFVGN